MSEVESRGLIGFDQETSRRNFLKTAAWAGAALSAAGIGGFGVAVRQAHAVHEGYAKLTDVQILQFAYQLELLEGIFYDEGVNAGLFADDFLAQVAAIRDHEFAHADALAATITDLGGEVPATPDFIYPDGVFTDVVAFLELAATFEPVGIGAYQGAAPAGSGASGLASYWNCFVRENKASLLSCHLLCPREPTIGPGTPASCAPIRYPVPAFPIADPGPPGRKWFEGCKPDAPYAPARVGARPGVRDLRYTGCPGRVGIRATRNVRGGF